MKSIITTAAVVVTSLLSFAQEVAAVGNSVGSAKTSAEVRAETLRAVARGEIFYGEAGPRAVLSVNSTLTRAEVGAKAIEAMARGEILHGEGSLAPVLTVASTLTRAEVRAETLAAIDRGEILHGEGSPYPQTHRDGNAVNAAAMAAAHSAITLK